MNKYLCFLLTYIIVLTGNNELHAQTDTVSAKLIAYKWNMVEALGMEGDTITDVRTASIGCEKDDYLKFETGGVYKILDQGNQCEAKAEVAKGTWSYSAKTNTITDLLDRGKEIEKSVETLNDERLKLKYAGDNGKIITVTYYSDAALNNPEKKEAMMQEVRDDSDPANYLTHMVWDALAYTNWYKLVNKAQLMRGKVQPSSNYLVKTVAVLPFIKTGTVNETALTAQAKAAGVDYVVTGVVTKSTSVKDSLGNFKVEIAYALVVIDVQWNTTIINQPITYKPKKESSGSSFSMDDLQKIQQGMNAFNAIGTGYMPITSLMGNNYSYNRMYSTYMVTNGVNSLSNVYTAKNKNEERKSEYEKNMSITGAIDATEKDLTKYLYESLPLRVPVNQVDEKAVVIECGGNMGLWMGMKLHFDVRDSSVLRTTGQVTFHDRKVSDGKVTKVGASLTDCYTSRLKTIATEFLANQNKLTVVIPFTDANKPKQ